MNLIQNLLDTLFSGTNDKILPENKNENKLQKQASLRTRIQFVEEYEALVKVYGNFSALELNLQELLLIVPRKRARIEAYQGLVNWLAKEQNIKLRIKSRKSK